MSFDSDDDDIINDCDCAPYDGTAFDLPSEIQNLRMLADKVGLEWDSDAANSGTGTTYDVMRGSAAEFPVGSGAAETCPDQTSGTTSSDTDEPLEGGSFYYLVRGGNTCGYGSYGTDSLLQERMTTACP